MARWLLTAIAILPAGCIVDANFGGTRFRCEQSPECPPGQACIDGVCQAPDSADAGPGGPDASPDAAVARSGDLVTYTFDDDGAVSVVHDRSGRRLDATLRGPGAVDGVYGGGIQLDGVDDHVRVPDHPRLFAGASLTVEAWVRRDVAGAAHAIWSDHDAADAPPVELSFEIGADDRLLLATSDGCDGAVATVTGGPAVPLGVWTHVAAAWDGAEVTFYVDGAAVDTRPLAATPCEETGRHYRIGRRNDGDHPFQGAVDEVKLSSAPRAAHEIAASMAHDSTADIGRCGDRLIEGEPCDGDDPCCAGATCTFAADGTGCADGMCGAGICELGGPRVTDGLVALYTFDEGAGTVVGDTSGFDAPLDLAIDTPESVVWGEGTLTVEAAVRIASAGAATKIHGACTASDEVTVEAWIVPANTTQAGPARILTISADSGARNVTLGQVQDSYIARLRSGASDGNGQPNLPSARGDVTTALTHLVFTRDAAGVRRMYVDGRQRGVSEVVGSLDGWSATYGLALANEFVDGRLWRGTFHLAAVYCRALSAFEVAQNYGAGPG